MPFQDAPPEPPTMVVLRQENHFLTAASRDIPLTLANRAGRTETAVARYQVFIKTQVQARSYNFDQPECVWILTTQLQRQLCFRSMTGQFACTESVLTDQPEAQDGRAQLDLTQVETCGLASPSITSAESQLSQTLAASAQLVIDNDLKNTLTPMLVRTGVTVKRAPQ